jgi:hypothetical protein
MDEPRKVRADLTKDELALWRNRVQVYPPTRYAHRSLHPESDRALGRALWDGSH